MKMTAILLLIACVAMVQMADAWNAKFARKVAVAGISVASSFGAMSLPALADAPNAVKPVRIWWHKR